jgi:hypothetical protein
MPTLDRLQSRLLVATMAPPLDTRLYAVAIGASKQIYTLPAPDRLPCPAKGASATDCHAYPTAKADVQAALLRDESDAGVTTALLRSGVQRGLRRHSLILSNLCYSRALPSDPSPSCTGFP